MSTITTIQSSDLITNSRTDINNNFSALNTDKMETSVLDTDTTLAANSDAKVATQKAVKAYVDAGGNVNASTTTKGIVEEADSTETNAGTATGATGARLYVNPSNLSGFLTSAGAITKIASGVATYDLSTASGAQNIAHGLGTTPKIVRINGYWSSLTSGSSAATISSAHTVYSNSTQSSAYSAIVSSSSASGNESAHGTTFRIYGSVISNARYQEGVVTVTSTNIVITWTKTSTPTGNVHLVWEALAA